LGDSSDSGHFFKRAKHPGKPTGKTHNKNKLRFQERKHDLKNDYFEEKLFRREIISFLQKFKPGTFLAFAQRKICYKKL